MILEARRKHSQVLNDRTTANRIAGDEKRERIQDLMIRAVVKAEANWGDESEKMRNAGLVQRVA